MSNIAFVTSIKFLAMVIAAVLKIRKLTTTEIPSCVIDDR